MSGKQIIIIRGYNIHRLASVYNNSSVLAMDLLQSCTKPSIFDMSQWTN